MNIEAIKKNLDDLRFHLESARHSATVSQRREIRELKCAQDDFERILNSYNRNESKRVAA